MSNMSFLQKTIPRWISYPLLVLFSFLFFFAGSFSYLHFSVGDAEALGLFVPFEGNIIAVDYVSCVCGLSMLITVEPTTSAQQGKQEQQLLFFYLPQALELLGVDFGVLSLIVPRVYMLGLIWYPGPQQLLGNYLNARLPCVAWTGTQCVVEGYYPAIYSVGTSAY